MRGAKTSAIHFLQPQPSFRSIGAEITPDWMRKSDKPQRTYNGVVVRCNSAVAGGDNAKHPWTTVCGPSAWAIPRYGLLLRTTARSF